MDIEQGDTYWELNPKEACSKETHIVLYKGSARFIISQDTDKAENQRVTYSIEEGQKVFVLCRTTPYKACAITIWKTEHPKLVIAHSENEEFYFKKREIPKGAFDLLVYMNAKFVYIEKTIERNFKEDLVS